jgi:hypothetical protein
MLSAKYQDTQSTKKNKYCFYIPIMNRLRKKSGKQAHSQYSQKIKYLGINLTK